MRVRFAPSPTGSLHLGNARTALFNWLVARRAGGTFVLRIEDTDTVREQEGSEAGILEDLRWLGLHWDEGPDVGGSHGPYRQSLRAARYLEAADRLLRDGRAYRCFCTDGELEAERKARAAAGRPPGYSGTCRALRPEDAEARARGGEAHAVRFRTVPPRPGPSDLVVRFEDRLRGRVEFPAGELGDPVLLRRDGRPTYNFAVVVDDASMEIDLVIRGDDHLSNTPRQVLIFRALGHALPAFAHLPMVRGADGERLSKRHGATSVAEYRAQGFPPDGLLNALALLGWSPGEDRTILTRDEMVREFALDRVSRSPAVFDPVKTAWISAQHIHRMDAAALQAGVRERLAAAGLLPDPLPAEAGPWLADLAEMLRTGIEHLDQVPLRAAALFARGGEPADEEAREVLRADGARAAVAALAELAAEEAPADRDAWRALAGRVRERTGLKGAALFHPLRVALTGAASGPELDRLVPLAVRGHALFPDRVASPAERARRTAAWLEGR